MYNINLCLIVIVSYFVIDLNSVKLEIGPCVLKYSEMCGNDFLNFYLTSADLPGNKTILLTNDSIIASLQGEVKLIIHGYGGGIDFRIMKQIQDAYLHYKNVPVITVDWAKLASLPCYPTAAYNTKHAGECIALFLANITTKNPSFHLADIHAIGFSLGAHVASFVSNAIETSTGKKISRITGLDPALPFFATSDRNWKLDDSDAFYVDVIHTNAGVYGKIEPSGHVDFYVNGGQLQPICNENTTNNVPLCSHMLSTSYFTESIKDIEVGFWGVRCSSYIQFIFGLCGYDSPIRNSDWVLMGENSLNSSNGVIYVYTSALPPYALGKNSSIYEYEYLRKV